MKMLLLKLLAIGIATGAGLLQIGLGYKWRDRRTKANIRIRRGLIGMMILGAIVAGVLVAVDDRQSTTQINRLIELKESAEAAASDAADREEEAKKDRAELKQKIDELQVRIDPFLAIAAARYPDLEPEKALERLADDVKELRQRTEQLDVRTRKLAARDFFRPLSPELRHFVVANLKQIPIRFPQRKISVSVSVETGHTGRQRVAKELVTILKDGGLDAAGPTSMMIFSSGVLPAVTMELNPTDEDVARALAGALNPFLKVTFSGRKKDEIEVGKITIGLHGEPLFGDDGVVTFP